MQYKRTPKYYNGNKFPQKKMSDLLGRYLEGVKQEKFDRKDEVFNYWYVIIGQKFKDYTRPLSLKDQNLVILVKSQTLYSLLCTHEKKRLLALMQKKFSRSVVKNIYFRIN